MSLTGRAEAGLAAEPAGWRVGVAAAWLIGFLVLFYQFDLPNNPQVSRLMIWQQVPAIFLELIDPLASPGALDSSWSHLPQRFDVLLPAVLILVAGWAVGCLIMRGLGLTLPKVEHLTLSCGMGLSGLSLVTLGCGLIGRLSRGPLVAGLLAVVVLEIALRLRNRGSSVEQPAAAHPEYPRHRRLLLVCGVAGAPFLLAMLLGATLPPIDFDVREYHLQGPKEFFQLGRVQMLPHNVYTSFPFLTEMLSLLSMVVCDDWYRGALAGKAVLATFAPLTALCVFAVARRWAGEAAASIAALIHISTPWTYRISVIAYAEGGLTFYLAACFLVMSHLASHAGRANDRGRWIVLLGLLAGSAMACKYPAAVSVVIPVLALIGWTTWTTSRQQDSQPVLPRMARAGVCFSLGLLVTVGPWLLKNTIETGNPVYPLLYTVFGGADWSNDLNEKWRAAHSPPHHQLSDLGNKVIDVTLKSDWLSPLLFALAPLALCCPRARRAAGWGWLYVGYLFMAWWVLTHRIDRFWLPLIPVVSVLAGCGATWTTARIWKNVAVAAVTLAVVFNLAFVTTVYCGYNAYLAEADAARLAVQKPGLRYLNQRLPDDARVLCVGEAEVFNARFDVVYETVFDTSIFEEWFAQPETNPPRASTGRLQSDAEILRQLARQRITHVYVNWADILRYRSSYGFTPFVNPRVFSQLVQRGLLSDPRTLSYLDYDRLSVADRRQIDSWGRELIAESGSQRAVVAAQLFRVPQDTATNRESSATTGNRPE